MIGLGTVINTLCIVLGGILGLTFGKALTKRFQDIVTCALGLSVLFIGAGSVFSEMLTVNNGVLTASGTYMLIFSLALGALVGEWMNIEKHTERFGQWLKKKTGNSGDKRFTEGFVNASLTVCIGAMAIIGSINDGLKGDYSILLTKGILDAVIIMVMSATYGKGCIFSALPVAVLQGSVTLLARLLQPLFTAQALSNLSLVGSVLIFCIGINMLFDRKIKVANLLPSVVFAVICAFIPWFN